MTSAAGGPLLRATENHVVFRIEEQDSATISSSRALIEPSGPPARIERAGPRGLSRSNFGELLVPAGRSTLKIGRRGRRFSRTLATKGKRNMTKHAMTSADRTKIIEALKTNRNAAAVARQFGFGETTILALCKKEGIGLRHLLTKAERTEVIELLRTNQNALATAKQLGVNHKTVLAVAKKERIDIKGMRQAAKGRKTPPFTQWSQGPGGKPVLQCAVYLNGRGRRLTLSLNTADTEVEGPQRMRLILWHAIAEGQMPKGKNHPAWRHYGGAIPPSIKVLLRRLASLPWAKYAPLREAAVARLGLGPNAIDWLTKQQQNRPPHPKEAHFQRSNARRKGKRIPMAELCGSAVR